MSFSITDPTWLMQASWREKEKKEVRSVPMYIGSGGMQFIFDVCHFDQRHAVGGPKWRHVAKRRAPKGNPAAKKRHALTAARCLDFASLRST
ncbi:MAG: hypothetical protein A2Z25_10680 [Planctomycetes bacterium RBG_16_55_9]|nr:MAG: hypothetical protein A2Z25_10680 [Planctomycetes bacterium RBG_16_55_9]